MRVISKEVIQPGIRVFVRGDLDVPIKNGEIQEAYRLNASLDTLKLIINAGGTPIIGGHIGKPDGHQVPELSTEQLKPYFDQNLGKGKYELLENLRFSPGEEQNSESFARDISESCQIYVNESFSTCHRKHASIVGVPLFLPSYAGLRLTQEVENLSKLIQNPDKPFVVIIGGAKLESKKPTVSKFLGVADAVLIGGRIGLDWREEVPANLILPRDYVGDSEDIGPETLKMYVETLKGAKTILWVGPLGKYEDSKFFSSTKEIANTIAAQTNLGAFSVIGGGDTIASANKVGVLDKMSFVSTGGGAMLEFLVDGTLPGIQVLE